MDSIPPTPLVESIESESYDLLRASTTINDLLASFSRATTPDGTSSAGGDIQCCCGRENCENYERWTRVREKLEKRLHLSAEVGQALLQRNDAYMRQQDAHTKKMGELERRHQEAISQLSAARQANDQLVARMSELAKQNGTIEKRLSQSQLNLDLADASNRSLLHEVAERRSSIQKLHHQSVRFSGLQARVDDLTQENNDMRDELAEHVRREQAAESRAAALAQRCEDLEMAVHSMHESRDAEKQSQEEVFQELVSTAQSRIENMRSTLSAGAGGGFMSSTEMGEVLEGLVTDNEALKRDNAELRNLLVETRENSRVLQDELDELRATGFGGRPLSTVDEDLARAASPFSHQRRISMASLNSANNHIRKPSWASIPNGVQHRRTEQLATPSVSSSAPHSPRIRSVSPGIRSVSPVFASFVQAQQAKAYGRDSARSPRSFATSDLRPLSPDSQAQDMSFPRPPSRLGSEYEPDTSTQESQEVEAEPAKAKTRPLLLLSRSRAVQADLPTFDTPILEDDTSTPISGRSRTVTMEEVPPGQTLPELIARITGLYNRLNQADVPTLAQRLKRQRLAGDVGHLSKSTIKSILNDVNSLRADFHVAVNASTVSDSELSRSDLRALMRLFKDLITHLAHLRDVVNDVTLDPSTAAKLKEATVPTGLGVEDVRTLRRPPSAMGGWIAPISKLFGGSPDMEDGTFRTRPKPPTGLAQPVPRPAPKLSPEVSASVTTVNVEFSGSGVIRRAVSTAPRDPVVQLPPSPNPSVGHPQLQPAPIILSGDETLLHPRPRRADDGRREQLRSIFAGSRMAHATESWVVLPRPKPSSADTSIDNTRAESRIGRSKRMSTHVDAMLDSLQPPPSDAPTDFQSTLLDRTLRRRGLSDSSMHSTFLQAAPVNRLIGPASLSIATSDTASTTTPPLSVFGSYSERPSLLQSWSRKVSNLTSSVMGTGTLATSPMASDPPNSPNMSTATTEAAVKAQPETPTPQIVVRKPSVPVPINIRGASRDSPEGYGSYRGESYIRHQYVSKDGKDYL
ncbi:hypothetical protein CALCODRAFT_492116 [Calocera cornea HHB12733]|uniref:Uncharacterized protein n=1 Tax=Calocera cornea HHB12733 TaxID=1353952 RepID=A0A165IPK3_9BASI|nr:hypothetical protein CALCODRAFT_492116 [Calocera cornea HHB12733]